LVHIPLNLALEPSAIPAPHDSLAASMDDRHEDADGIAHHIHNTDEGAFVLSPNEEEDALHNRDNREEMVGFACSREAGMVAADHTTADEAAVVVKSHDIAVAVLHDLPVAAWSQCRCLVLLGSCNKWDCLGWSVRKPVGSTRAQTWEANQIKSDERSESFEAL
jgi:hypothetical protein